MEEKTNDFHEDEISHCQIFINKRLFNQLSLWKRLNNSSISSTIEFFIDHDKLAIFLQQRLQQLKIKIENGHDTLIDAYQDEVKE